MKVCLSRLNKIILFSILEITRLHAATLSNVPQSVNPANVTWDLENQTSSTPAAKKSSFQMVPNQPTQASTTEPEVTFVLKKVVFAGNTTPIPPQVLATYQKSLHKSMDLNALLALAQQMQDAYRAMGYILVQVVLPPQEIDQKKGVVTFQVIEGQIQNVIFTGDDPLGARSQLQHYATAIENENPITYQTIDHFLVLANDLPGINVTATLVPNKSVAGGADLVINVAQHSQSAFVNFNNRGTQYIGPSQAFIGASAYDLFGLADTFSITGATTTGDPGQLGYFTGSYDLITGPYSTDFNINASSTQTRPGNTLAVLSMVGYSDKYTFALNQPLIASTAQNLTLNTSFYHLDSNNKILGGTLLYDDKISAFTAGLTYNGIFLQTLNNVDAYASFGVPILGAPSTLSNPSRVNGTNKFTMFDFDTSSIHYLTQKVSFDLASTGQVTQNPLLTSEQLGFGGINFGQAFTPYIISGDNGLFGSLALRYDLPTFAGLTALQPQAFYDIGMVSNNQALPGTYARASASSAGLGLNMTYDGNCKLDFTIAKPLTLTQASNNENGWQAFVNFVAVF